VAFAGGTIFVDIPLKMFQSFVKEQQLLAAHIGRRTVALPIAPRADPPTSVSGSWRLSGNA